MSLLTSKAFAFFGAVLLSSSCVYAADWYAKDVRFAGHDPSIVRSEDGYALMVTNNMLTLYTSEDAMSWKDHGKQMKSIPSWLKNYAPQMEDIWAPDLYYFGGEYRVYYTGSVMGKRSSGIGVMGSKAIFPSAEGFGWSDYGEVYHTVLADSYNSIDADVAEDADGNYWMVFGSWGTGIKMIKLDPKTGKRASDDNTLYELASRSGKGEEGPSLIEHDGKYFLFTAWDVCCSMGSASEIEKDTYHTRVGRADKITGPYLDKGGVNMMKAGGTVVLERYGRYYGPGGGEAFKDLNRIRFVHHYYDREAAYIGAPTLHVRDVVFNEENWPEMGQPFLGRYLSAEAEHGQMTRSVSGDLVITNSSTASNGEYVAYINTSGSKIRFPMNIMQAGEYLLRYRYANGDETEATHKLTVNGKSQGVKLPPTGGWGTFPEKSVVLIPATLKRGGNFIEVEPGEHFSELDRIDFLRIVRDTLPGNGFDNGIRVRLNENDELSMKDGGWALFENVVTDSIVSGDVYVQVKNSSGGTLSVRADSKDGSVISSCKLSTAGGASSSLVHCSSIEKISGVKDLYLTVEGINGELCVGNVMFKKQEPASSDSMAESSESVSPTSSDAVESSESSTGKVYSVQNARPYIVTRTSDGFAVQFEKPGNYSVYVLNSLGQIVHARNGFFEGSLRLVDLPRGRNFVKLIEH